MCGGRSSILHYGPLIEINYLYAPTPNGQSPSASLNKSNTTPLWRDCSVASLLDYSTYNNTHRVAIVYSQRQETDHISGRNNIKTRDPGSKSAKC